MTGTVLGRYRLDAEIRRGGMGSVYRATDTQTGRLVAVKVLPQALAADRAFVHRFRREVRSLQQVHHPNVIRIFEVGSSDGVHYFAMEYLERSLADELSEGPLPPQRALEVAGQVARGLQAVHAANICHRDVKPSNILFDLDGQAKISDFGIARVGDATRMTHTSAILGTPTYMAPEQADSPEVDHRADVYSLGVVLYEMLCGQPPFQGQTPLGVLRRHRYHLPEQPKMLNPRLPAALSDLVLSMLEKAPSKRPGNMGLLANAIERLRRNMADERRQRPPRHLEETATERADRIERSAARTIAWLKRIGALAALVLVAAIAWRVVAHLRTGPADYFRRAQRLEASDYETAVETYEALIRRFPDSPQAVQARQRVNHLVEQYELGSQPLLAEQARHAMRAEMAYLHFRRAREAAERSETEQARRIYEFVCDHFSDTQWAPRADARLVELDRLARSAPSTANQP
ncbi:MAG: protein kinase domain-containing protein [bacterium]